MNSNYNSLSLLSISKVAQLFKVGRDTVKKLLDNGRIGYVYIGKSIKIPYSELKTYLEENLIYGKTDSSVLFDFDGEDYYTENQIDNNELIDQLILQEG